VWKKKPADELVPGDLVLHDSWAFMVLSVTKPEKSPLGYDADKPYKIVRVCLVPFGHHNGGIWWATWHTDAMIKVFNR
jgi:hypothetical protein